MSKDQVHDQQDDKPEGATQDDNPEVNQDDKGKQSGQEETSFNQDQVNNIVTREKREATEKMLKELGVDDFDSAKDGMEKFREWQESQMTEQEKQSEDLEKTRKENETLAQELNQQRALNIALRKGSLDDTADDVVALAERQVTDDVDIEQAIDQVLEKYPSFTQVEEQEDDRQPERRRWAQGGVSTTDQKGDSDDPFAARMAKYK